MKQEVKRVMADTFSSTKRTGWLVGKPRKKVQCTIQIKPGECSNGNKELVASSVEEFLNIHGKVFGGGYKDIHSSMMRDHLEAEFPEYDWHKNTSQRPFDIYSIEAGVAIENKSQQVGTTKDGFGYKGKMVVNATLYPDKAKVKDVVPKSRWRGLDEASLDKFMDVLVVAVDKAKSKDIVRYKIVDGSYWNVDYPIYSGCSDLFNQINNKETQRRFLELIYEETGNHFVKAMLDGKLSGVNFDFRKLITVDNPNAKE